MSQLNNLLESANPYKSLQSDAARLASKWAQTGLLEGLEGNDSNNMSMLLENQAKQLVTESSTTGGGTGAGTFTPGTGAQWAGVALPLVRKVFGQIAAKEFVSVQPMNLPSGLVFYLDFQYGTTKAPFAAGNSMYGDSDPAGTFGNTNTGGLYGAGRYSYSTQTTGAVGTRMFCSTASWSDLNFQSTFSASAVANEFKLVALYTGSTYNLDMEAVKSFQLYDGGTDILTNAAGASIMNQFTHVSSSLSAAGTAQNAVVWVVTASLVDAAGAGTDALNWSGSLQPTDSDRGDFEDGNNNLDANNNPITIPQVNVQMSSEAIVAKTKKLKAVWTPEFAQDLNAYHSLDAEAELTSIMSEYISLEIDLEILDMLMEAGMNSLETWSAVNNRSITGVSSSAAVTDLGFYNSQGQWFQTLGTKIQKLSNVIHQKTLRGGASFLVCSPTVGTIIESIPGFASTSDGDAAKASYAFGVQKVGQLNGRYQVYKNPYMTTNQILIGYRGTQFLEAGAVFAPYIPLIMTPMVYDPNTFTPRKGLLTRYAKKMLRPEYYGIINCNGLNTI